MADEMDIALAQAFAKLETEGVATIHVSDGEIFFFSKRVLEKLLAAAGESPDGRVTVFVKSGQIVTKGMQA